MGNLVLQITTGTVNGNNIYECDYLRLPFLQCMTQEDIQDEVATYLQTNIKVKCYTSFTEKSLPYDGKVVEITFIYKGATLFTQGIFVDRDELIYYLNNGNFSDRQLGIFIKRHIKCKWKDLNSTNKFVYA